MPASMTANSLTAFRGFRSMTRPSSTPAGPTIERPGSMTIGQARRPDRFDDRLDVLARREHAATPS